MKVVSFFLKLGACLATGEIIFLININFLLYKIIVTICMNRCIHFASNKTKKGGNLDFLISDEI